MMRPNFKSMLIDMAFGSFNKTVNEDVSILPNKKVEFEKVALLIPGFLSNDSSLKTLKKLLEKNGYVVYTYKDCLKDESFISKNINMGWNERHRDLIKNKANLLKKQFGKAPLVIGWSLGGVYALNIFKEDPDIFSKVITLASPFNKTFSKNSSIKWLYDIVSKNTKELDKVIMENSTIRDKERVITVAAERDGLIDFRACVSPYTKSYVIDCYHMDIVNHPRTLKIIEQEAFNVPHYIS